jgi:hypothetical protein
MSKQSDKMKLFNFEKNDITRHIEYELKTLSKFKEPLKYVIQSLINGKHVLEVVDLDKADLNKLVKKEKQGKNYHWSVIVHKNVTLVLRRYRYHFTIFTMVENTKNEKRGTQYEYGSFSFKTDFDKFGDKHDEMMDVYYDKPFTDLNVIFKNLVTMLSEKDSGVHWVWNSASLPRPKHVDIELFFADNNINSIDGFIFCIEELSSVYLEIFAETTMIQRLKQLKEGDKLGDRYKILSVSTETKNNYFHDTGLEFVDKDGKKEFKDVYTLSRYYLGEVFGSVGKIYLYKGEVYLPNGENPVPGEAAAYKDDDEEGHVIIFDAKYRSEAFVPLKKF